MDVGRTIRLLRTARELTQAELAGELNISRGYLSQVEGGRKKPSLGLLEEVSRVLEVPLPLLVYDSREVNDVVAASFQRILGELLSAYLGGLSESKGPAVD